MSAKRKPLRKIVVEGVTYLWKVEHDHLALPPDPSQGVGGSRCREVFTAFLEGYHASPVRIRFPDGVGQSSGYPQAGVVWTSGSSGLDVNLNTPRVAAGLIRIALSRGWTPGQSKSPMVVEDGFFLLAELPAESPPKA
ncbi:hypothetical protein [Hyalangium versicolor]|uniref:hypothetical protein n=1 Tax=Hyalangium versicolor TaxID=2861190 RepID=UPI001CCE80BA|nr:hypothetical protein [Hyalangium versicolor]